MPVLDGLVVRETILPDVEGRGGKNPLRSQGLG
jgi:hypothetical protein